MRAAAGWTGRKLTYVRVSPAMGTVWVVSVRPGRVAACRLAVKLAEGGVGRIAPGGLTARHGGGSGSGPREVWKKYDQWQRFSSTPRNLRLTEEGEEVGGVRQDRVTGQRHGPGVPSREREGHARIGRAGPVVGGVAEEDGAGSIDAHGLAHQVEALGGAEVLREQRHGRLPPEASQLPAA